MDNDQESSPALGAGKGKRHQRPKIINEIAVTAKQNRDARQNQPPLQPGIELPLFEDAILTRNWALVEGMIDEVIDQIGETCVSICMCRSLQAIYNQGKVVSKHLRFCEDDLNGYIVKKTKQSSVRNLNTVFQYALHKGLLKKSDTRRSNAGRRGLRIKAQYEEREGYTAEDVYAKAQETPIAISLENTFDFYNLGAQDIYVVPSDQKTDHAVLVVGVGETTAGVRFLVIQNSWGKSWGNLGYGRIHLKPEDKFDIFWADRVVN